MRLVSLDFVAYFSGLLGARGQVLVNLIANLFITGAVAGQVPKLPIELHALDVELEQVQICKDGTIEFAIGGRPRFAERHGGIGNASLRNPPEVILAEASGERGFGMNRIGAEFRGEATPILGFRHKGDRAERYGAQRRDERAVHGDRIVARPANVCKEAAWRTPQSA
jgi:hypothetical protein